MIILYELEILGRKEDESEQCEERHSDGPCGGAEAGDAEDPHVEHRVIGAQFAQHETGEECERCCESAERGG